VGMTRTPAPQSLLKPMRAVLRWGLAAAAVGLPLGAALGFLIDGAAGAWGALLGFGIAVIFFTLTVGVSIATARLHPQWLGMVVLASWLLKLIGLIGALVLLRSEDFYSRGVFFAALLIGTFGYLTMEAFIVSRTKVLYVEPELAPDGDGRA